ncbi:cell division protein FtsB [Glaciimonas immobilis]|uniref:Cell division protein FtsB n=1 Tax=Glaciimonas immobilis TaxID=728004 RepID=A0A840S1C1_9BURK|nr:cell division protein FtsB [Glaciimonas immobilis]MBB5202501.1 cell division protein FtsB [Glaciimonas immobilis]
MRLIAICLTILLVLIQYPLWLGKGGWLLVADMGQQVVLAHEKIDDLKARNAKLGSEVHDLKEGTGAVEERARTELGMIKQDEIFVQILNPNNTENLSTLREAQQLSDKVGAAIPSNPLIEPKEKSSSVVLKNGKPAKLNIKEARAKPTRTAYPEVRD